jgi:hypothetical protein
VQYKVAIQRIRGHLNRIIALTLAGAPLVYKRVIQYLTNQLGPTIPYQTCSVWKIGRSQFAWSDWLPHNLLLKPQQIPEHLSKHTHTHIHTHLQRLTSSLLWSTDLSLSPAASSHRSLSLLEATEARPRSCMYRVGHNRKYTRLWTYVWSFPA